MNSLICFFFKFDEYFISAKLVLDRGHIGILESDVIGQNNSDKKTNEDLIKPIDFDLNEDFDFEKNLEIFRNYVRFICSSLTYLFPIFIIHDDEAVHLHNLRQ